MLMDDGKGTITLKRRYSGAHFEECDAQGIQIARFVARLTFRLFRRNIQGCANRRTGKRASSCPQHFHNAKIRENRFAHWIARRVVLIEQDIRRFDITVNHSMLMSIINRRTNGGKKMNGLARRWEFMDKRSATNVI